MSQIMKRVGEKLGQKLLQTKFKQNKLFLSFVLISFSRKGSDLRNLPDEFAKKI